MISNCSASGGRVSSASSTRPSRFASSLWAGKKYDSRGTRAGGRGSRRVRPVAAGSGHGVSVRPTTRNRLPGCADRLDQVPLREGLDLAGLADEVDRSRAEVRVDDVGRRRPGPRRAASGRRRSRRPAGGPRRAGRTTAGSSSSTTTARRRPARAPRTPRPASRAPRSTAIWSASRQRSRSAIAVGTSSATPTTSATTAAGTPSRRDRRRRGRRPSRARGTGPPAPTIASTIAPPRIASHVQAKNTGPR